MKDHFQGQTVNLKVKQRKLLFLSYKARSVCNTSFSCDYIILVIRGDPQGQKVNFKVIYDDL